ncbi:MAG: transposase, partial [Nitrospinota bacterium]|nr:transposase [Nitrospinota bacterium]
MAWRGLTDWQWKLIQPHLPPRKINPKGGRPWADNRKCFEGILWILWTGAPWSELP